MSSLQDLFTHNRAWAAQMEKERPGFFTGLIKQQHRMRDRRDRGRDLLEVERHRLGVAA